MVKPIQYVQDNSYLLDIEVTYVVIEKNKKKLWKSQI